MLKVNGIEVQVVRKDIKNLHLSVCPPDGHVRVSAPESMCDDNVRLAIISRLAWIKRQRNNFQEQNRQSPRGFVSGECHYFLGKPYRLELFEGKGKSHVYVDQSSKIYLHVRTGAGLGTKQKVMDNFYREELKRRIPELLEKWQPIVGRTVNFWGIKKMKTKWGSCNTLSGRIWLNLELAKKPPECLEYILVHEMVHLLESSHNARFSTLMSEFMPKWKSLRQELNALPVRHETWTNN